MYCATCSTLSPFLNCNPPAASITPCMLGTDMLPLTIGIVSEPSASVAGPIAVKVVPCARSKATSLVMSGDAVIVVCPPITRSLFVASAWAAIAIEQKPTATANTAVFDTRDICKLLEMNDTNTDRRET
jgi:hypothetical protein